MKDKTGQPLAPGDMVKIAGQKRVRVLEVFKRERVKHNHGKDVGHPENQERLHGPGHCPHPDCAGGHDMLTVEERLPDGQKITYLCPAKDTEIIASAAPRSLEDEEREREEEESSSRLLSGGSGKE